MLCPQRRKRKEKKQQRKESSVNATRILCNELNNFTSLLLEIFNKPLDNNVCIILKIVYKNIAVIIFLNIFSHKYTITEKTQHKTTLDCTIIKRSRQFRHPSNHVQPVKVTFDRVENMHGTYIVGFISVHKPAN
jgi:hypothetical protein